MTKRNASDDGPPPPGLKLEGGSLIGEAAKYTGKFRFVHSKLVTGRPAYQHMSDATRWIAFDGDRSIRLGAEWSVLGQKKFHLYLADAAAASPDVSAETWTAWTGSGLAEQSRSSHARLGRRHRRRPL